MINSLHAKFQPCIYYKLGKNYVLMDIFSRRFTLVKSPTITVTLCFFCFFFRKMTELTSNRSTFCTIKSERKFAHKTLQFFTTSKFSALQAIGIQVPPPPPPPPTKFFGTVRQKFFEIFSQKSWYLSKTQFFFSILIGSPHEIFRHCETEMFFRRSWYLSNAIAWEKHTRKYENF